MTDDILPFGLGSLHSPPDERDWGIDELYAISAEDEVAAPPPSWMAPRPYPPQLNQGTTPECVACGTSSMKGFEDLRDQGPSNFDEHAFFRTIGGGPNGAVPRVALQRLVDVGYPVVGGARPTDLHRIAGYYAVPVHSASIRAAFVAFGPLGFSVDWQKSWFNPGHGGVLPRPNVVAGGHFFWAVGYNAVGVRARNSWGQGWGDGGYFTLPWDYLGFVKEVWKVVDQIVAPPDTRAYTLHLAPAASVRTAVLSSSGCISAWNERVWGPRASRAPCQAPVLKPGCVHGRATVAFVTSGEFAGDWVRVSGSLGVSVTAK